MMLWIALALGAVALAAIGTLQMARSSRRWPTVEGRVLSPEELKAAGTLPYGFAFEYIVCGTRYISGTVELLASAEAELEAARRHQLGSPVVVYYNPTEPRRGMLIPGASKRLWRFTMGIVSASVIGAALVLWPWAR
jgi:Protein of unknown function (DUF3592)